MSRLSTKKKAYALAGVDVDLGNTVKSGIQRLVQKTHGPEVLGRIGGFGGFFRPNFGGMVDPILVASVDGVGTKLKVAFAVGRHDTIGQDLVNHCINDIAVTGARPLFFLDYVAAEALEPKVFRQLLVGFTKACKVGGCALIGGETAQMPDLYKKGEYDVAGCIVGVVDRKQMLDGSAVRSGDIILGLPSNGLHTNGYSLARRALFENLRLEPTSYIEKLKRTVGEELLRVHRNYQPLLASLPSGVLHAAAHITGGGLIDNLPRILPKNCDAIINTATWKVPFIFRLIQDAADIEPREMYQVFNMGIGMALIVSQKDAVTIARTIRSRLIGRIVPGAGRICLEGFRGEEK